jgi:hypothetical protein
MNSNREEKLKSWLLLIAGMIGIGYQQYTGKTDWVLLLIFTAMTGVPGVTTLISLIKNSPTTLQSLLPQQDVSEQESESSSNESSADSNERN